jgi:hypothetical protein
MRQDAIRRSHEMQRRAAPHPAPLPPPEINQAPPPTPQTNEFRHQIQGLLSDWDGERLALLALLYLLYKEGTDPKLLLAIGYIML